MPEPKRPLKVFLCHAHADRDAVRALYTRLTNDGVDAWLDKEKLLPGQDWELEIKKAVREADVVVVCLSKQFNQAGFRQKEVRLALDTAMEQPEGEIFIIPARLEECDVVSNLLRWHWVNLFEGDGYRWLKRSLRRRAESVSADFLSVEEIDEEESISLSEISSISEMIFCLWGVPGAGKSTYLTMLQYANSSSWMIFPHDAKTQNIHSDYVELVRDKLEFIPPTPVDTLNYLTFDVIPPKEIKKHPYRIKLPEAAGEMYEKIEYNLEFFGELSRANGIIWLIDPERFSYPLPGYIDQGVSVSKWLNALIKFNGGKKLMQPMAFCLSKMDLPIHRNYFDNPKKYCLEILGRETEKMINTYCDSSKVSYFATSSVGFTPGTQISNRDDEDPSRLHHPAEPINLFQPIKWLFDVIDKV